MADAKITSNQPVRVSVPLSLASDAGRFKKMVGSVLERLGCPACCSGHDILFEMQRRFVFDGDLDVVRPAFGPKATPTVALTAKAGPVTAGLSPRLAGDIKQVNAAIDRIIGLSAHPNCTSGDDLLLQTQINILINLDGQLDEQVLVIG